MQLVLRARGSAVAAIEGFGLPCGRGPWLPARPLVATRAGALPEVVATGGGGILVERDDPASLAAGIRTLLDDPDRRAALGRRGRTRIAAAYSWPRIAAATADVYAELVAERGRPASSTTSASVGSRRASQSSASSAR